MSTGMPAPSPALVRIDPGNAGLLRAVAVDVFDDPVVPEHLAAYLANPDNLLILAIADGEAIGMVMAVIHRHPDKPAELYIDEVGVTPRCRRHGVARLLMDAMIAWGRERSCREVWLGTEIDNVAARALYAPYAPGEAIMLYTWPLD